MDLTRFLATRDPEADDFRRTTASELAEIATSLVVAWKRDADSIQNYTITTER